jgi:hypothetical protein
LYVVGVGLRFKIASNKMRDNWTKTAQHLIKYKQKGKGQLKRVTKEMKSGRMMKK